MRNHRTSQELESIVAAGTAAFAPKLVESARRELAIRSSPEEAAFERKVRLSGNAAAIVGAFFVVWPVLLGVLALAIASEQIPAPREQAMTAFDYAFAGVALLQVTVGALLLAGGLLTRRRRAVGPRLVSAALVIGLAYVAVFTVFFIVATSVESKFGGPAPFMGAFSAVMAALWTWLLWLPLRFFSSPRVRGYCTGAVA